MASAAARTTFGVTMTAFPRSSSRLRAPMAGEGIDIHTQTKCFFSEPGRFNVVTSQIYPLLFWPKAWLGEPAMEQGARVTVPKK
jgi:hypothetical protein